MLSNEQRAHDLAIAILQDVKQGRISEKLQSNATEIPIDFYAEYKNAYNIALALFNRDFPSDR